MPLKRCNENVLGQCSNFLYYDEEQRVHGAREKSPASLGASGLKISVVTMLSKVLGFDPDWLQNCWKPF